MKVKTFRGRSVQQAISKIKSEIGPDAIIMSTKRVPKNRTNPYGEQVFEVIASLPEPEPEPVVEQLAEASVSSPSRLMPEPPAERKINKYIDGLDETGSSKKDYSSDEIFKELLSIKDMLFKFPASDGLPEEVLNFPGVSSIYSMLIENGVSQRLSKKIIMESYSREKDSGQGIESFRKTVFMEMISRIEVADPFEKKDSTIAAAFIGPTGVGKTTTIAKIAAELTLNEGKKVGLVSVDNYRVGALKQLETYAAILGIPCMPAFEKDELEKAVERMRSKDVVLIDTAGISSFDEEKLTELKSIFETSMPVTTHLVLSLTSSLDNLKESSQNFSELNPLTYVFTKLDEIGKKGALLDQLDFMNLPISFIANGQKVPEDIERAGKKTILKKIFTDK